MEKISITVRVPALDAEFDFSVPIKMSVRNAELLMVNILSSEYGVSDKISGAMLFDVSDAKALRMECSLEQLDVSDGAKLILI